MTNTIKLSTGKEVARAFCGIVGLAHDDKGLQLYGGFDDRIESVLDDGFDAEYDAESAPEHQALTAAECVELADIMLAAWTKYRAAALEKVNP